MILRTIFSDRMGGMCVSLCSSLSLHLLFHIPGPPSVSVPSVKCFQSRNFTTFSLEPGPRVYCAQGPSRIFSDTMRSICVFKMKCFSHRAQDLYRIRWYTKPVCHICFSVKTSSLELNFRLSALSFFSGNKRQKNDNGGVNPSLKPRDGLGIWLSLYEILGSLGSTTELRKLRP